MLYDLRFLPYLAFGIGIAVLGSAFAFQHVGGLAPCVLCIYQRWPWVGVIALSALVLFALPSLRARRLALAVACLLLLVGTGIAGYHVGVEQNWWAGTAECGDEGGASQTAEDLKRQLMATEVARCDEAAWSLFGISMAGWNMLISLGMAGVLAMGINANRRSQVA